MKYIVWVKEKGQPGWEPNGEGPYTQKQAERIARDLVREGYKAKVLPVGQEPEEK